MRIALHPFLPHPLQRKDRELNPSGAGVAVVPGSGFFMDKKQGFVRLCVAGQFNTPCEQGMELQTAMGVIRNAALAQMPERLRNNRQATQEVSIAVYIIDPYQNSILLMLSDKSEPKGRSCRMKEYYLSL